MDRPEDAVVVRGQPGLPFLYGQLHVGLRDDDGVTRVCVMAAILALPHRGDAVGVHAEVVQYLRTPLE